ncbi:hypothetical protein HYS82_03645 [Candidatus Amesbacteria bacterium]|nr:hypothetical protein [Candidatus Amesbacteria bacterium]MBI2587303.1 hypothetical protein [Candidatus Amesbacteria bacterium]
MPNRSSSAIELAEEVIFEFVERNARQSYLRLGRIGQKIAANANNVEDQTLLDLYMQAAQAKEEYDSWMDW